MIEIKITGEDYEQDIRPLVKSFYPEDDIVIAGKEKNIVTEDTESTEKKEPDKFLDLNLEPDKFQLRFWTEGREYTETEDFSVLVPGAYKNDGTPDRRMYRNYLHRRLYEVFRKENGKELPWGTLTGVRPVKQVLERLEAGEAPASIDAFLQEEYYCSKEKRDLSLAVAKKENELLTELDYKNERVEQKIDNLVLETTMEESGSNGINSYDSKSYIAISLNPGDILLFDESRGYYLPRYPVCSIDDAISDINSLSDIPRYKE